MNAVKEKWVNVGQRPVRRYFPRLGFTLAVLLVGSIAVANRSVLCQLQAYSILVITLVTLVLYAQYNSIEREFTVETYRDPYCVDCMRPSRAALIVGRQAVTVSSSYERLYFCRPREYLIGFCWLAWIAYGSVFHEGKHSEQEDAYVADVFQYLGNSTVVYWMVPYARVVRNMILWIIALALTMKLIRPTTAFVFFFLMLFAPSSHSTPQALSTHELVGRTCIFVTLFFMAELLKRATHYAEWIKAYKATHSAHISSVMMALGLAQTKSFSSRLGSDALMIPDDDSEPSLATGRSFSLDRYLSDWTVVIESSWIMVASDWAIVLALIQTCLQFLWFFRARKAALESANIDPTKTRIKGEKPTLPVTIKPKAPAASSSPPMGSNMSRRVFRQQNNLVNTQAGPPLVVPMRVPPQRRPPPPRTESEPTPKPSSVDVAQLREQVFASMV